MNILKKNYSQALFDFFALISSHIFGTFFNVGVSLFVTKFLAPTDYGIVASQLFLFSFCGWFFDWGAEQTLLATDIKNIETAGQIHAGLRVITSLIVILLVALSIGFKFITHKPTILVLTLLCAGFVCEKLSLTYKILLEKSGALQKLASLELFASMLMPLTVLLLATYGFGPVALVSGQLVQKGLLLLGYIYGNKKLIRPLFDTKQYLNFLKTFGFPNFMAASFGLVIYDFMPFLIAQIAGVAQAGLYARAFTIATMPLIGSAVFGRIFNTVCAQNLFESKTLAHWFCVLQCSKFLLIVPAQLLLIFTSPWWSNLLFGSGRWGGFILVYTMLAAYGLARAFYDDVTCAISVGFKNPWVFTFAQGLHAILIICCAPLSIFYWQATGAAVFMALSMSLVCLLFWQKIFHFLGLSLRSFARAGSITLYKGLKKFVQSSINSKPS